MRVSLVAAILLGISFIGSTLQAAPRPRWRTDGNVICGAPGAQHSPAAISDDTGGMIVFWQDQRRGPGLTDFFAQRVAANGAISSGWPDNGALVIPSIDPVGPLVSRDGAGGALVLYLKNGEIRAQHLLSSGTLPSGADPAGRLVASGVGGPSWSSFTQLPDGAGGAYVMWLTFDFSDEHVKVERVDSDGAPVTGWETPVEVFTQAYGFGGFAGLSLAAPPLGGAIVAASLRSERPGGADYFGFAKKLASNGSQVWSADLNALFGSQVLAPSLLADAGDGAILRVQTLAQGDVTNHLDGSGQLTWPTNPGVFTRAWVAGDGSGGVFQLNNATVYRTDGSGAIPAGWTAAGVSLNTTMSGDDVEAFTGGIMLAWADAPAGDIRASAVTVDGTIATGWSVSGNLVCSVHGTQSEPTLIALDATAGLVAWTDTRRDAAGDIYASLVVAGSQGNHGKSGPAPPMSDGTGQDLALIMRPSASGVLAAGALPFAGDARLDLYDVAGRRLWSEAFPADSGPFERALGVAGLPRGIYWARLSIQGRATIARFVQLN